MPPSSDILEFIESLKSSTKKIQSSYIMLPVAGAKPRYHERVYCYELYHQLRCNREWESLTFSAEVKKQSHPFIQKNKIPDLILHKPGHMWNLAVVEVKPINGRVDGLGKDLATLTTFRTLKKGPYELGLLLIYGDEHHDADSLRTRIHRAYDNHKKLGIRLDLIRVFWHRNCGEEAIELGL